MSSTKSEMRKLRKFVNLLAQRIATLPEEDRATAASNMHAVKISKRLDVWFLRYACGQTDRQTCLLYELFVLMNYTGVR